MSEQDTIQSIILSREVFPSLREARSQIREMGLNSKSKVHTTAKNRRFRQVDPKTFARFRSKKIAPGIVVVIGINGDSKNPSGGKLIGIRHNWKPTARVLLKALNGIPIAALSVCRRPIRKEYESILNLIAIKPHDRLFHLFLVVDVILTPEQASATNGVLSSGTHKFICEKNQELNLAHYTPQRMDQWFDLNSELHSSFGGINYFDRPSLPEMLQRTLARVGEDRFFHYDAFTNNCQRFVMDVLETNGFASQKARHFILQDVHDLVNTWVKRLGRVITDSANIADQFVQGF